MLRYLHAEVLVCRGTCTYITVRTYVGIYTCRYSMYDVHIICPYVCMYAYMYAFMYIHTYECMYESMYVQ